MQREREQLQAVLSELRVAEGEAQALQRDDDRLARDLAETAHARAERESLTRELEGYPALHLEFQKLEALARDEGRRLTLLETRAALTDEISRLRERRSKLETAPKLETENTGDPRGETGSIGGSGRQTRSAAHGVGAR